MTTPPTRTAEELLTELVWCRDHGMSGPRTYAALLETIAHLRRLDAVEKAAREYIDCLDNSEDEESTSELREALAALEAK